MHVSEQLPHVPVSTSIAEERTVIQVDFLLVDLYVHLHDCQFKSAGVPLPDIFHVMITENKIDFPIQSVKNLGTFMGSSQAKIPQMEHDIILTNYPVPVFDQRFIHIFYIFEWPFAKANDIRMIKVCVRCKIYLASVKLVIHFALFCAHRCAVN